MAEVTFRCNYMPTDYISVERFHPYHEDGNHVWLSMSNSGQSSPIYVRLSTFDALALGAHLIEIAKDAETPAVMADYGDMIAVDAVSG